MRDGETRWESNLSTLRLSRQLDPPVFPGDSRHTRSSVIPGTACGFRRRLYEMGDLRSSSRQIFQKGRGAGGSTALEPTMHPAKRRNVSSLQEDCSYKPQRNSNGTVRSFSRHRR